MELSFGKFNERQKDWSEQATTALRANLCEFPAMFAKCVLISADEFHTATATFADFGHGPLAITCAHVITDCLGMWRAGRALIRVGNLRVSPSQLAGFDKEVDTATIRLSEEQAADLMSEDGMAAQFYRPHRWPPDPAKKGESVSHWWIPRPVAAETVLDAGDGLALLRHWCDTRHLSI
jgi:hypothetical protein